MTTDIDSTQVSPKSQLVCEYCEGEFIDILSQAALVWRSIPDKSSETLTAFRITHRSPKCVNKVFYPAIIPQWLPLSTFFENGEFTFEYFSTLGDGIEINKQSLARVEILLNPLKVGTRVIDKQSEGFVYLIQSPTGVYKIGRTSNPKSRMKAFSVALPFEADYICLIPTVDMFFLEKELHKRYADKRIKGEWFNLSPVDVEYIKGLAK